MKFEYRLGEDIFLAGAAFLVAAAIILRLFGASITIGFAVVKASTLTKMAFLCLGFNIALNLQDLVRK